MKEKMNSIKIKAMKLYARTSGILADNRGEGYIDTAIGAFEPEHNHAVLCGSKISQIGGNEYGIF